MNDKVVVTLPLAIILFVLGVYCPPTENEFPTRYELLSCKSDSASLQLNSPGSTFEIAQDEQNPRRYCLIQTLTNSSRPRKYCFRKLQVQFSSMKDAELTMIIYRFDDQNITRSITCVYPSIALARTFYKDMTLGLHTELMLFMAASSLKKSDNTVLVDLPRINLNSFAKYVTIVIKNAADEVVFIFPASAIYEITQSGDEEISVYIGLNSEEPELYKFGCPDGATASALSELLNRLMRYTGDTSAQTTPRPFQNSMAEFLFKQLERKIERRME